MKRKTFTKRILAVALSIIVLLGVMPLTATAASTSVPGAEGHVLTDIVTGTFEGGYDSTIFVYVTPNVSDSIQYQIMDNLGCFAVPTYDSAKWHFAGWKTWYKGSNSGAGLITSDEANPKYDDNEYYFTVAGFTSNGVFFPAGSMRVLKETLWKGTYYLSAIFEPLVTVNAGEGISYAVSGATKRADNKYSVKYYNGLTIDYSVADGYIVTGASADSGTNYSDNGDVVSLTNIERPATVNINARLKQQKVNFDANGGNGAMTAQTFSYGETQALSENSFSKTGYIFAGWNTKADGTGTTYPDKQSVAFTPANDGDSITLYAQWQELPAYVAPSAKELTYNGSSQELVNPGSSENGTMLYSLSENGEYGTSIPEGTDAGSYTVWYYVDGSGENADTERKSIPTVIEKAVPTIDDFNYVPPAFLLFDGENKDAAVTVKDSISGMGNVAVSYYTDEALMQKVAGSPVEIGTYYVALDVAEGTNYKALTQLKLGSFTIEKIGKGISSIEKTSSDGLVDTYTITYTDGTTTTFTVTNGEQGEQGIQGIPGADGHTPVIEIKDGYWYIDGVNTAITAAGVNGTNGKDGITPQLRINSNNIWEVSYDNGVTWESLGIRAVGQNGNSGITPKLRVNSKSIWEVSYDNGKTWESLGISAVGSNGTNGVNGKDGTDGEDGKDGADGKDGITPKLQINPDTNMWEVSYDGGKTWESLGVAAAGADGITPQLRISEDTNMWEVSYNNGETWTSMGVVATGADGKDGGISILPIIIACISLMGTIIMFCMMMADHKKSSYSGKH